VLINTAQCQALLQHFRVNDPASLQNYTHEIDKLDFFGLNVDLLFKLQSGGNILQNALVAFRLQLVLPHALTLKCVYLVRQSFRLLLL
jgi:hypothetical protein